MSQRNEYSDEHISAYIDGELDNDERARLLFDEQEDAALAQRVNEVRMLKEKIQLAYPELPDKNATKTSFNFTTFTHHHRTLVASLFILTAVSAMFTYNMSKDDNLILAKQLIKNTQPISANSINDAIDTHKHVVIHVSQYDPRNFTEIVNHIETLLYQRNNDKSFSIEIVANGRGLKALDIETSIHAERISQLAKQFNSLEIVACAKSLAQLAEEGDPIQLMKSIMITPSAAHQISKRINEDWFYLKV